MKKKNLESDRKNEQSKVKMKKESKRRRTVKNEKGQILKINEDWKDAVRTIKKRRNKKDISFFLSFFLSFFFSLHRAF